MLLVRAASFVLFAAAPLLGQGGAPSITRIDPPNWWANMPRAMLLVNGDHLQGAHFRANKPSVRFEKVTISPNGHWAELWLASAPSTPVDVTLTAETAAGHASAAFRFLARRAPSEGFSGFTSRDVMYLIMTDRFADGDLANDGPDAHSPATGPAAEAERSKPRGWHGGDFRGIVDHLDYLQLLGITTVWITPAYQNHGASSYHGYGATDMYAVDEHFGTLGDFQALAAALHARGMKLVLDTVPNHIGATHPWVTDEPEPDWFHGTAADHRTAEGNFLPLTDPHAPDRDRRDVTDGWFADVLPDMNQENPAVSQYLIQNAIWWVEEGGLDGLRIDTFPFVGRPFWARFNSTLHELYPHLTAVGEVFNGDPTITSSFAGGVTRTGVDTGLYTPFDYPLHFGIRNVFTGAKPMTDLAELLRQDSLYPHAERLIPFLDNHDVPRFLNEPNASPARQRLALAFLLTNRGMPQLYTGDEIAMRGGEDPDNRHDFPGGFPVNPGRPSTAPSRFDDAPGTNAFSPAEQTPSEHAMFTWTQSLLKLRSAEPALQSGDEQLLYSSADTLAFIRASGTRHILVGVHLGPEDTCVYMPISYTAATGLTSAETLFGGGSYTAAVGSPNSNSADPENPVRPSTPRAKLCLSADSVWIAALR